jgi:hypothetical protein
MQDGGRVTVRRVREGEGRGGQRQGRARGRLRRKRKMPLEEVDNYSATVRFPHQLPLGI